MAEVDLDPLAGPEGGKESARLASFWNEQIEKIGKDRGYQNFIKRGHKIEARYRDERNKSDEEGRRRYNSLWSNVEILKPAIYGKTPMPLAERKFGDKDSIARGAAQILERALRNEIEICGFNEAMCQAVSDYLLPGRGTVWVRYEPEFGPGSSLPNEDSIDMKDNEGELDPQLDEEQDQGDDPVEDKLEETGDQVVRESTPVDFIHWEDFLIFPVNARTWAEVVAVGKRVYLTFEQMKERFGRQIAKAIPLQKDERQKNKYENSNPENEVKGEVFEIWNKEDRRVYWVAEDYDFLMDRKDDPLNLEHFFPVPRPIIANQTTGTLTPVADYIQYQDQATQIDELSQRIAMLTRACKVAGVYDASAKGLQRLLNESVENELIPVDGWASFADKGGIAGAISYMPLREIIGTLNELMMLKAKQIEEMNTLTGISDLMSGTSDARETLGGQRLKSNYTGTRLSARQNEVARFARDTVRIMADIMAQHFSPQSLVEASGAMYEEGLGVDPNLLQQMQTAAPPAPGSPPTIQSPSMAPGAPPAMPHPMGPPGMPGQAGAPPQQPMQPPMTAPAPPQPGTNVVPFQPRAVNLAMPSGPPVAPPVAPGIPGPPPPDPMQIAVQQAIQRIDAAISLIRNERLRGFRVDIEVDSTIYGDAAQEKGDRTEFISEVTKYLQTALAMSAQVPEITPLLGKLLQFGVRGFRVGRDLESSIEEFCDEAVKISKQKQQQAASQPNPEQIKANAQAQAAQATSQSAIVRAKADVAKSQADIQGAQIDAQTNQQQAQAEVARQQIETQGQQQDNQTDLTMKEMDIRMKQMEMMMEQMRMHTEQAKAEQPQPTNPASMTGSR